MTAKDESFPDEALTELLKKDAKDSSIKYSALGLQAFLPKRPTGSAPKPNTRFLRNIIQETNTHNAALKAKEIGEAAERMKDLKTQDQYGDGSHKRKRDHRDARYDRVKKRREEGRLSPPPESESRGHHRRDELRGSEERSGRARRDDRDCKSRHRDRRHNRSRSRSRSRSPPRLLNTRRTGGDEERRRRIHERSEDRHDRKRQNRSRGGSRSGSPHRRLERHDAPPNRPVSKKQTNGTDIDDVLVKARRRRHREGQSPTTARSCSPSPLSHKHRSSKHRSLTSTEPSMEREKRTIADEQPVTRDARSDSDPLDEIIGPAPPPAAPPAPRPRGRGAVAAASGIDARFASSYDPTTDLQPDDLADDDWEMVLEAHKDRQRMQQQHAERLRAAGFTEKELEKWKKKGPSLADGSGSGREEDVVWRKKGEGREWDRGKVWQEDEDEAKPSKGRKGRQKGA